MNVSIYRLQPRPGGGGTLQSGCLSPAASHGCMERAFLEGGGEESHFCLFCLSVSLSIISQFNTRVKKTACFDHLVQANVRNKKVLKDAVQNITAKGITNYTKGFEFAFEQLSAVNKSCLPPSLRCF